MNLHLSEVISEMVEPLVDAYQGGNEIISTEDLKAGMELLNVKYENWKGWDCWDGVKSLDGEYSCCVRCMTDDEWGGDQGDDKLCECVNVKNVDNWEDYWETEEGQDTTFWTVSMEEWNKMKSSPVKVKPMMMKRIRKEEWKKRHCQEVLEDIEKIWKPSEVLPEDIQDFEKEMVIIGCDVESLYPSLDTKDCGRLVEEEIMRTDIEFENLDYLEGARLIALNKSAEYCRRHELHRVLPVRRKRTGSRPGVTGKGPLGQQRGDQEQWKFPNVTLTPREKRLLVAEVAKIIFV